MDWGRGTECRQRVLGQLQGIAPNDEENEAENLGAIDENMEQAVLFFRFRGHRSDRIRKSCSCLFNLLVKSEFKCSLSLFCLHQVSRVRILIWNKSYKTVIVCSGQS